METQEKTTDELIEDHLNNVGVKVDITLVGEDKQETWVSDQWRVKFTKGDFSFTTDYRTGIGHRKRTLSNERIFQMALKDLGNHTLTARRNLERMYPAKPVTPKVTGIIHALLMDARSAENNFNDWCSEYGYDSDSISAFKIYQACMETQANLRKLFNTESMQFLEKTLEDY